MTQTPTFLDVKLENSELKAEVRRLRDLTNYCFDRLVDLEDEFEHDTEERIRILERIKRLEGKQ